MTVAMMLSVRPALPAGYLQMPIIPKISPNSVQHAVKLSTRAHMPSALLICCLAGTAGVCGSGDGTGGKGVSSAMLVIVTRESCRFNDYSINCSIFCADVVFHDAFISLLLNRFFREFVDLFSCFVKKSVIMRAF